MLLGEQHPQTLNMQDRQPCSVKARRRTRDALRAEPPSPATVQTAGCADKQNVQEALTSTKMLRTGRLNGPAKEAPNATWGLCIGDVQLVADARRSSPVLAMCDDANGHVPDNASPHRPPIAP